MAAVEETDKLALEEVEVQLLTEGIYRHYGFDFRDYSLPSLRRRIWKRVYAEGLGTISALLDKVLHDAQCMERLLFDRRRGLLNGHPAARGRPLRALPHLRDRHQRAGAAARQGRHLSAGDDA